MKAFRKLTEALNFDTLLRVPTSGSCCFQKDSDTKYACASGRLCFVGNLNILPNFAFAWRSRKMIVIGVQVFVLFARKMGTIGIQISHEPTLYSWAADTSRWSECALDSNDASIGARWLEVAKEKRRWAPKFYCGFPRNAILLDYTYVMFPEKWKICYFNGKKIVKRLLCTSRKQNISGKKEF